MDGSETAIYRHTDMKKHTDPPHSFWSFGDEQKFRPHVRHTEPVLTECNLDWTSRLRWLPEPRYGDAPFPHIKDIMFPHDRKLMRSFPQANMMSRSEWRFYPEVGQSERSGKRCFIDRMTHTRSMRCISENSLESAMGRKRQVTDKFSSLTRVRPFLVPEYSPDFHKRGSTARTTTFGSLGTCYSFIHLKSPPKDFSTSYAERNKNRERDNDIVEVERLNTWKPAPDIYVRTALQDI